MKSLADDDVEDVKPTGPAKSQTVEQPAWMRALLERCREWLTALPEVCVSSSAFEVITNTRLYAVLQYSCEAIG